MNPILKSLVVYYCFATCALLHAAPPDLTAPDVISGIDRSLSYNLGSTGLRGWIYLDRNNVGDVGLMTDASRQILVTVASAPADSVIQVDDVILGAVAANSGSVPDFTSDCRKAFGAAIGEAEKTGAGTLRVKRWRAGTISEVNIPMVIMGNYTATAPYSCPKSAQILAKARDRMVADLLSDPQYLIKDYASPIRGLALLSSVTKEHPDFARVQTALESYARDLAKDGAKFGSLPVWDWAYQGLFLSEYYLQTADPEVLSGINNFTLTLAKTQSIYGTYGHGPAVLKPDGSNLRICTGYGPVNSVGTTANLAIYMGKMALLAGKQKIDPEIDLAIKRGSNFFGWYTNKGSIPYGEHAPGATNHASNGKDGGCAVFFGLQPDRAKETEYFSRVSISSWIGREYGHTGQGLSYLWTALGANMGGPIAVAEHLNQVRWHIDLARRTDGSFAYDGQEQYGMGSTANGTYLGKTDYSGMDMTAAYVLTYSIPLKRLHITGKAAIPTNALDAAKVANAVAAGSFRLGCASLDSAQLIAKLNEFDPVVRHYAAVALAKKSLTADELVAVRNLLASPNVNERQSACQVLGLLKDAAALSLIVQRLGDVDLWVRAEAANAIRCYEPAAASVHLTDMLKAFTVNATDPNQIDWNDPLQICNGRLSLALFGNGVGDGTVGNDVAEYTIKATKELLYPAIKAGLKQPDSYPRTGVAKFCRSKLPLADVQALMPDMYEVVSSECQADRMWSASPRAEGLLMLADLKIAEGIPLALSILEVPKNFEWGSQEYLVAALNALAKYGDAARYTLPTLRAYVNVWNPKSPEYAALVKTIEALEKATDAPKQHPGSAVADRQVVTTSGAQAITLTGSSPRGEVTFVNITQPAHGKLSGTAPNLTYTPAPGYKGIDSFTFQTKDALTTSATATVGIVVGATGTGLKGEYFDDVHFSKPKLTRTDAEINFDWGTDSPDKSVEADTFSVRWSGLLLVPETGNYTFSVLSNEGVRLYINGVPIIDQFEDQETQWIDAKPIKLAARQLVEIQLEYYENAGPAVAKLKWTGPAVAGERGSIIPKNYLFDGTGFAKRTPYAHAQNVEAQKNTAKMITLTGSGGTLRYAIKTKPQHGTLTGKEPYLVYTPAANYSGPDSFTFMVNNGLSTSAPATVSISVSEGPPQIYTWKSAANGNMSLAANWADGSSPAASGQPNYHLNFAPAETYSVTHDLSNGFKLNQLLAGGNVTFEGSNSFSLVSNGTNLPQFNQNSPKEVVFNAPLNLEAMTLFGGSGSGTVTINSLISGSGGFTKNNPGVLKITNFNNTYTGGTVLNAGKVSFATGNEATSFFGTGPVTINPFATLEVDITHLKNAITLNGATITGGNSFMSSFSSPVTLIGITTFDFGSTGGFEISGDISGEGGFTTVGTFTWKLSGNNTHIGPTTIQAGTLSIEKDTSLSPSSALVIHAGGIANLNYEGNCKIPSLTLGGKSMPAGSYGSKASNASNKDDTYFSGPGKITVDPSLDRR
jgi:autotransporter-associated beta strand protein